MMLRKRKSGKADSRAFTQLVVPEPSFRRGVASIADISGKLFVVNRGSVRARLQSIDGALRADRRRVAEDFAAVKHSRGARHGSERKAVDADITPRP